MPADIIVVHILLATILFFLTNWLGRHSITSGYHQISLLETVDEHPAFNFVFRVATPLVYIAITAACLYALVLDRYVKNFYFVVIDYFALRWLYNVVVGRGRLLNWSLQLSTAAFTVGCAYFLDRKVLSIRGTLLPEPQSLNSNIWVLIIIFLYTVLNGIPVTQPGAARRRQGYIVHRYQALREAFASQVSEVAQNTVEENLVYAVLIYETFNRPFVYRAIERRILFPLGFSKTLGPMQVETRTPKSDIASVKEGATKLVEAYRRGLHAAEADAARYFLNDAEGKRSYVQSQAIRLAAQEYNIGSDYATEVLSVYDALGRKAHPSVPQP